MKKIIKHILFGCLVLTALWSCQSAQPLSGEEWIKWMADHPEEFTREEHKGNIAVRLNYQPAEYHMAKALRESAKLDKETVKEYESFETFTMQIAMDEVPDKRVNDQYILAAHEDRMSYYTKHLQNDLKLVISGDTIGCQEVLMEPFYQGSTGVRMNLVFHTKGKKGDRSLVFKDRYNGSIQLDYTENELNKIPHLVL